MNLKNLYTPNSTWALQRQLFIIFLHEKFILSRDYSITESSEVEKYIPTDSKKSRDIAGDELLRSDERV